MNKEPKTNKLSIYLIKEAYVHDEDILKQAGSLSSKQIDGIGVFYYDKSRINPPAWITKFFERTLDGEEGLLSSTAKAVLLAPIQDSSGQRIFAIAFGYGWTLLNPGIYEERFGLRVTVNVIGPENLRQITKRNLTAVPKDTREQLSKMGGATDFGIDIEQDLIQGITGASTDDLYGKTITGKDALSISARIDISNIKPFLEDCFEKFQSDSYKKNFGWIDQVSEIKDPKIIAGLDDKIIERIKTNQLEKIWMAVPEIVEWAEISGFAYTEKYEELEDDIHLLDFIESLTDQQKATFSLDTLHKKRIFCFSASSGEFRHGPWKAYDCLYSEIYDEQNKKTYLLSNGKWYEVKDDFANQVNADYQELRDAPASIQLPHYDHKNENDYNTKIAEENTDMCCMDCKNIAYGGGYSKIEFCDLFTRDNKIIHVKHYGGSSVLSHLFSQGVVSGELFLADKEFRKKVNSKLSLSHQIANPEIKPTPANYEIVFAVISSAPDALEIPFFSKVSLRNARRRLETFGYSKISLQKISIGNQQ